MEITMAAKPEEPGLSSEDHTMTKVVITAQVDDLDKWEKGFRTHGELFKGQGVTSPVLTGTSEDNEVAVYEEVDDISVIQANLESPETIEAMANDGVRRDTVKLFVLDKDFAF
jgi:hypothetical protein